MVHLLRFISALALLPGLLFASAAQAQINKCVDANGKTVYSQAPCPASSKASSIRQAPVVAPPPAAASGAAKAAAPKTAAELERDFRKRRAEQEENAKKDQDKLVEAQNKDQNCKSARGQLANLQSGQRQIRVDENGDRTILEDDQVAKEAERLRQAVQNWCN